MPRLVSLIVLAILIAGLGAAFYQVLQPFLLPLFLAAMLAILLQPLFRYFLQRTGNRKGLAAGLTTAAATAVLVVPLVLGMIVGALQLYTWASRSIGSPEWVHAFEQIRAELDIDHAVERLRPLLPPEFTVEGLEQQVRENLRAVGLTVAQRTFGIAATTVGLLGALAGGLLSAVILLVALFYFLADGRQLFEEAERLLPLERRHVLKIGERFVGAVRAVVTATFAAALAQGLATGLALALCGFHRQAAILTILATISALVPLAGTWLVWGPCACWLAWEGHWTSAGLLTLYGSLAVGTLDNVVRTYVLNSDVKLHPLLALVSVLGGLQWMGLWGVLIGPIVASCLHALVEIFNTELRIYAQEFPAQQAETPAVVITVPIPPPADPPPPVPAKTPVPTAAPKRPRNRRK